VQFVELVLCVALKVLALVKCFQDVFLRVRKLLQELVYSQLNRIDVMLEDFVLFCQMRFHFLLLLFRLLFYSRWSVDWSDHLLKPSFSKKLPERKPY
jgi:hypothetical protein